MRDDYNRVFEKVQLPPERRAEIRATLSARLAETKKEENFMYKKSTTFRTLAVALVAILATLLVSFTFGEKVVKLLSGGQLILGGGAGSGSMAMEGFSRDPVEVRDGRIYFTLDGSDLDITDQCSESSYYQYEIVGEDGTRQVVVVGGTPEDLGFALFVWLEDGIRASTYDLRGEGTAPWLRIAEADFLGK